MRCVGCGTFRRFNKVPHAAQAWVKRKAIAHYMLAYQINAAGVEHFRELLVGTRMQAPRRFACVSKKLYEFEFQPEVFGGGLPVHINLSMVKNALGRPLLGWERTLCSVSQDSTESEVAGTILLLGSVNQMVTQQLVEHGWSYVPLREWVTLLKPHLNLSRRAGMLGNVVGDVVYELRKLLNVTLRENCDADFETEFLERNNQMRIKSVLGAWHPLTAYMELGRTETYRIAKLATGRLMKKRHIMGPS